MNKLLITCVLTATLAACGTGEKKHAQPTINPIDAIIEKAALYKSLIGDHQDEFGFIHSDKCDSLLFSGLISYAGVPVQVKQASNGNGKYFRTPYRDCYKHSRADSNHSRRSGSEISRDSLAGLFWAFRNSRELGEPRKIIEYGKSKNWIMGAGAIDRTYLTPNFVDTLYKLANRRYNGPKYIWIDPIKDHQRHIVALNIDLQGDIDGHISDQMYNLVKKFHRNSPNNKYFSFIRNKFSDGDQKDVIEFLLNERYFPSSKLPTSQNYCTEWLWMRHEDKDSWQPCGEGKTHTGGDFIFLAERLSRSAYQQ